MNAVTNFADVRHQLMMLAGRKSARVYLYGCRWEPTSVRNPADEFGQPFTEESAWQLVADALEAGEPLEEVVLRKPEGKKAYVLKLALSGEARKLYVKLQLGAGQIIGRSFHYSDYPQEVKS